MTLDVFAMWMLGGRLTGGLAGFVMRDGGHRRIWDLLLGLATVTTFASAVGAPSEAGRVALAVVSVVGAAFVIVSQRKIWPAQPVHA